MQLLHIDQSISIRIELPEGLHEFLLSVGVLHFADHQRLEFLEINGAIAVLVDLKDHIMQLGLSGVLAETSHNCSQLLGGNTAIAVLVKECKGLLELGLLLVGQLVVEDCILVLLHVVVVGALPLVVIGEVHVVIHVLRLVLGVQVLLVVVVAHI